MIPRAQIIALTAAALSAVALPVALLRPSATPAVRAQHALPPLSAPDEPPLGHVFGRPLFTAPGGESETLPADAPQLTGIVGRLGSDAVALVRTAQGTSRSLAIGDSVDGWRLESLSIDAALFSRGGQRARVPLPAADPETMAQ
ncbi:hypothetical protein CA233_00485 [Sphingomonas sp. ABOLD]|uniref:General secretion pathway protein N n=1 Tax=Sphingomonas trueperi TaxID=53317 RepID=A0A7X5XYF4_9SPHN|nr:MULTISPECIES: hypothetical protein [Sphingomonas]NJB97688.1 hypothetical protein [Sphingomonas trueperi]RSV52888.1 hypothetical protein CA233_00485 [Sphingomonas sp. ABOLD]